MKTYEEPEYANNRLKETVVRLKDGTPIQILAVQSATNVVYIDLSHKDSNHKVCKLSDLNIDPVPLGYCNLQANAIYLVRMPMRQDWKQGLRHNSLRDVNGRKMDISLYTVAETIVGKFPAFRTAIDKLNTVSKNPFNTETRSVKSVAFNRDFAIKAEGKLLEYKGIYTVGTFNNNGGYDLKDRFGWVEDCLKLAM